MSDIERQSGMDPAEGSREAAGDQDDLGRDAQPGFSHGGTGKVPQPTGSRKPDAGGISNRPLSDEQDEQDEVPERGERKEE
jgi:hypothetical protein